MKSQNYKLTHFSCYTGYIIQAVIVNLAPLFFVIFQNKYNISYASIANLILINFGSQLIIDAISLKLCDIFGYRTLAVAANVLSAVGLACLGILPQIMDPLTGITIAIAISAVGSGFIEVIISPIIDAIPQSSGASSMSLLHSFYCWGQLITVLFTTIALTIIGDDSWVWIPLVWAIIPFINTFLFASAPIPDMLEKEERMPIKSLLTSKDFIILMILMVCGGSSEIAVSQWASLFAEKGLGVSKTLGDLLGPCMFALFMGIGRTLFGVIGNKIDCKKALSLCAFGTLICYLALVFVPNPIVGLAACALTGFGISLMWPGTLALGSSLFPRGGMAIFTILALCGDLGCSVGPWITGQVSNIAQNSEMFKSIADSTGLTLDQVGIRAGLLICAIFPLILMIAVNFLGKKSTKKQTINE